VVERATPAASPAVPKLAVSETRAASVNVKALSDLVQMEILDYFLMASFKILAADTKREVL
jgi:hypothetical protein